MGAVVRDGVIPNPRACTAPKRRIYPMSDCVCCIPYETPPELQTPPPPDQPHERYRDSPNSFLGGIDACLTLMHTHSLARKTLSRNNLRSVPSSCLTTP